ncbi:MAG: UDP-3-O-(3-hydroxymyristoyl)glucosamine N-acyltransferase [Pyrinomonadaceae bacterium]
MKLNDIADIVSGKLIGEKDSEVYGFAAVSNAETGEITFVNDNKIDAESINASCVFVSKPFDAEVKFGQIIVPNPKLAFAKIAREFLGKQNPKGIIHRSAEVSESAKIGGNVDIGAFCSIGENTVINTNTIVANGAKIGANVKIGENCVIHPNVVIENACEIGANVIIHAGVVIGADGFGFVRDSGGYVKFPQIGRVVIEDDVEIGANSCVDRGALGETRIGAGTKIDNLVQIAHNVSIGKRVVIASQTGISGSVVIEDDCVIGGQVGFGDHTHVKAGAVIGSKAGVLPGKIVREGVWWGIPIEPLHEYKRKNARVNSLGRLIERVKLLEQKLKDFEND